MMDDILILLLGGVVTAMTILAVMQIGVAEDEDPAHGTSMSDVAEEESDASAT